MMDAEVMVVTVSARAISAHRDGSRIAPAAGTLAVLAFAGTVLCAGSCRAGPEVMVYITVPVGSRGGAGGSEHIHGGLRMDRHPAPAILGNSFTSPFTRRALIDLQMDAEAALRLQVDRTFSYDFARGEWAGDSRDMTLPMPARGRDAAPGIADTRPWFTAAPLRDPPGGTESTALGSAPAVTELNGSLLRPLRGGIPASAHHPAGEARRQSSLHN